MALSFYKKNQLFLSHRVCSFVKNKKKDKNKLQVTFKITEYMKSNDRKSMLKLALLNLRSLENYMHYLPRLIL